MIYGAQQLRGKVLEESSSRDGPFLFRLLSVLEEICSGAGSDLGCGGAGRPRHKGCSCESACFWMASIVISRDRKLSTRECDTVPVRPVIPSLSTHDCSTVSRDRSGLRASLPTARFSCLELEARLRGDSGSSQDWRPGSTA